MVGLSLRSYLFLLLTVGIYPELVVSESPIIEAFADSTRLLGYIQLNNSSRTECFIYSDSENELPINENHVTRLSSSEIDKLISNCTEFQQWSTGHSPRKKRAIFPGTKWCGIGDIAGGYSDLGKEKEVDMCCRDHDHCDDFIKPFRYKYGLFNFSVFTRSHCNCDRKFKRCLKKNKLSNNKTAVLIYNMFFRFLKMTCFEKKLDQVCTQTWIFTCLRYQNITKWAFSSP